MIKGGLMKGFLKLIETDKITDNLEHKVYMCPGQDNVILSIELNGGKSKIEKIFNNGYFGKQQMAKCKKKFDTEEKVCNYLNLGEKYDAKRFNEND